MWAARKRRFRKDQQKTRKLICDCTSNTSKETSTVVLKKKRQSANLHESPSILHTFMYLTGCKTEAYFQWLKWAKMLRHSCRSNHTKSGKSGSVCKACMTLWAIPRMFFWSWHVGVSNSSMVLCMWFWLILSWLCVAHTIRKHSKCRWLCCFDPSMWSAAGRGQSLCWGQAQKPTDQVLTTDTSCLHWKGMDSMDGLQFKETWAKRKMQIKCIKYHLDNII